MRRLCLPRNAEAGMVSIIVTLILIFIITIVVMGFSVIIQRNERQVLDRNLSSRAFYTAESGVNMAIYQLQQHKYLSGKSTCQADNNPLTNNDYIIDTSSSTQITCLTIDNTPTSLVYDGITKEISQVIPLNSASGTPINSIDISWQGTTAAPSFPTSCNGLGQFPADGAWTCQAPLLRIDLVPSGGSGLNRDSLLNNVFTVFAFPVPHTSGTGSGSVGYANGSQGIITQAYCSISNTPRQCKLKITGLGGTAYTARVMSFYSDAKLMVCANGTGSCDIHLQGTQAVIDSTARAMDVVRRIQVRYPLTSNAPPDFAIQTAAGLCKRYGVIPGNSVGITGTAGNEVSTVVNLDSAPSSNPCSLINP